MFSKILEKGNVVVSSKGLGLFRIGFSLTLFIQSVYFYFTDFYKDNILDREIEFPFFDFLKEPNESTVNMVAILLMISSLIMATGKWFKTAATIFLIGFTYIWLLDKGYFNNHYYFISLITFLMLFSKMDSSLVLFQKKSVDVKLYRYWIIIFQLFIVFFIAGINKLTYDWLVLNEPMKSMLLSKFEITGVGFYKSDFMSGFMSWGGLVFELLAIPLLYLKKTQKLTAVLFIVFNLFNLYFFMDNGEIGFFPILLISFLPLFFYKSLSSEIVTEIKKPSKLLMSGLTLYFIIQILIPFRHVFYNNHVDWSGEGQRFSWRMKIMVKEIDYTFYIKEKDKPKKHTIQVDNLMTKEQYGSFLYFPDMIPTVADYLKKAVKKKGMRNVSVLAKFNVGLNSHDKQPLIDSTFDLSSISKKRLNNEDWLLKYDSYHVLKK